jgi:transposase, IS5 family
MRHPLVLLAGRLPWSRIEAALATKFERQDRPSQQGVAGDMFGEHDVEFGGGVSNSGRPRLSIRLMASLVYLKNSFNLSDEELVQRWSENLYWQFFSGLDYFEPRLPCDATQIGRFRRAIGEEGLELLLKTSTSYCTLFRRLDGDKARRTTTRATGDTFDQFDVAGRFVEASAAAIQMPL